MEIPRPTAPLADLLRPAPATAAPPLETVWARHLDEVRAAQRLRHRVFAEELGARLSPPAGVPAGHDADDFDEHCEHLLVRTVATRHEPARVVGTYRVLTPWAAARVGRLYSDGEFDLAPLATLRPTMVELGRSCVDPEHRDGGVILALWGALAGFMQRNGLETMIGCASVGLRDGGHYAAALWRRLIASHAAPAEWQVTPRLPLPVDALAPAESAPPVEPPPLIKGYLRCGARVLGAPAWDPDFNTADLPLLMRLQDLPSRYRRHFMSA